MTTHRSHHWYWVLLGVLLLLGLPGACQKEKTLEPGPTSGLRVERVEVDRTTLGPGDSTEVRAWVVQGDDTTTPVPGVAVDFRELPERGSGTFSKLESATDLTGWATTIFRPAEGVTGTVTIRVQAGESIQYAVLQISPSTVESFALEVSTFEDRMSLPADGESTLEVTVTASTGAARTPVPALALVLTAGDKFQDQNGNGVYDSGEPLVASGDRNGNGVWDPEGSIPERVQTNEQGTVLFRYQSGLTTGPVYLRITGGGISRELTLQQHSLQLAINLTPEARELLADGATQTRLLVTVTDWSENPVGGVVVKFTSGESFTDANLDGFYTPGEVWVDGNSNGHWDAIGSIPASATTEWDGTAIVSYTAGLVPGDVVVRATTTNGAGQTTLRLVTVPPAASLQLQLSRSSAEADGVGEVEGQLTVKDIAGVALAGKTVRLVAGERFEDVNGDGEFTAGTDRLIDDLDGNHQWTSIGDVVESVISDVRGQASFVYTVGSQSGRIWIKATVDGVSSEAFCDLDDPAPVSTIALTPAYDRMTVSGGGGATSNLLQAVCRRASGATVPAGTRVSFRVTTGPGGGERLDGAVSGVVDALTDETGTAEANLLSGTRSGWVQVRASVGSVFQDAGIYVEPGPAISVACRADSVSLIAGSQCLVSAWVYDVNHNPVADGTEVRFAVDEGQVVPVENGLTTNGLAVARYISVPPIEGGDGRAVISVSCDGGGNGIARCESVVLVHGDAGPICHLQTTAALGEIGVRGTGAVEQTEILAFARDCEEDPAPAGQRVLFRIVSGPDGGEYLCGSCNCDTASGWTDRMGIARVVLTSGTKAGTVLIQAEVTSDPAVSASAPVAIAAGPPFYISVGAQQCNVLADGYVNNTNEIVALVYDQYRNPVRDGTAVYFTTDHGMIEGDEGKGLGSALTVRGVAQGVWHSDGIGGVVNVIASTHGGSVIDAASYFIGSGDPYTAEFLLPSTALVSTYADGESEVRMRVEVLDHNGLFVLPADVTFECLYGTVPSGSRTEDGCNASYADGVYQAPTLVRDDSYTVPDDGVGAIDVVSTAGGFGPFGDSFQVQLRTGNASASRSAVDLENLPPNAQSFFTVTVKDAWGNPLGGHALSLTATQGTITDSGLTDSYGVAGGLSFTAPDSSTTVYVEVRDLDPNHGGNMILRRTVSIAN